MIEVTFDRPPTANNFYFNLPRGGRAVSAEGKAWRELAGFQLNSQHPPHVPGPVNLDITVADSGRFDLDGIAKPTIDLLVGYGLIEDDNRRIVRDIHLSWAADVKGIRVKISEASE